VSLDLIVLTPDAASSYARAFSIYQSEDEEGDPASPDLRAFADELDARYGDDNWPFTGDPLLSLITCRSRSHTSVGPTSYLRSLL